MKSTVQILAAQYERKAMLKEKELDLRREELEFQKKKWQLEEEERKLRLQQDLEQRAALLELIKKK